MHSHSFQGTKFKLLRQVKDKLEQVMEGLTILRYPRGFENKGLITQKLKFNMHLPSFQDAELTRHRYVKYSQVQDVGRLKILPYPPKGSRIKG